MPAALDFHNPTDQFADVAGGARPLPRGRESQRERALHLGQLERPGFALLDDSSRNAERHATVRRLVTGVFDRLLHPDGIDP